MWGNRPKQGKSDSFVQISRCFDAQTAMREEKQGLATKSPYALREIGEY